MTSIGESDNHFQFVRDYDNGQYVAVAVSEDGAEFDGYPDAASFSGMTTYVVRIADGELVGSVRGDASDWCA